MDKTYEILIIAKNTAGIGAKILSLFNRRSYSVEKMTSGDSNIPGYARLTLSVRGNEETIDQIQKQVYKLVDVTTVKVFPTSGVIRRELMIIKVKANSDTRVKIVQIADIYRGNIVDVGLDSVVIELTGDSEKLEGFEEIMSSFGILEIAKTGVVAMSRGKHM